MRISLIGMAGSGKSYWSKKLVKQGFKRFCCDDLIEKKLADKFAGPYTTKMNPGKWMGFPYEPGYKKRESLYLAFEREVVSKTIEYLENSENNSMEDIVVDTTGSVIYTGKEILGKLRKNTTIVYLTIPIEVRHALLKAYVSNPHPMLWRDIFQKGPNDTVEEALAQCYPLLVQARERLYEQYSDIAIDYYKRRKKGFEAIDLINEINRCALPD